MKKIAILGAGISGLALATYLQKFSANTLDITLYEKGSSVGGWIKSKKVENAIFECGPRSLRTKGSGLAILELIEELKLQDAVIESSPLAKNRYIVQNETLQKLPNSLLECCTSPCTPLFFKALLRDLVARKKKSIDDESVYDFFSRRFGRAFTDTFIDPLTCGIWAVHPKNLSIQATFFDLWEKERAFRSLLIGLLLGKKTKEQPLSSWARSLQNKMLSFCDGIELLPKTLAIALAEKLTASIFCNERVYSLCERENKVFVETKHGAKAYDMVFSTLAAHDLAPLLAKTDPLYAIVNTLPSTSLVTVSFGFQDPIKLPSGFGFLCDMRQESELLGIVFDSNVFCEHNGCFSIRLSVMMGKTEAQRLCAQDETALRKKAEGFIKKYLKIEVPCTFCFVQKAQHAISGYDVGHLQKVEKIHSLLKGKRIELLGTSFYGVSVGDCIQSAKKFALEYCQKIAI